MHNEDDVKPRKAYWTKSQRKQCGKIKTMKGVLPIVTHDGHSDVTNKPKAKEFTLITGSNKVNTSHQI